MMILAMFPGQGSQFVGMGKTLLEQYPYTADIFATAEAASGAPIRKLCLEGDEEQLKLTANTQPCILTVSVAYWEVLKREKAFKADYFAGHSLGEYSALVASGKLPLDRAAFLVRRRGEAMQAAVPAGVGSMAAVMNCTQEDLEQLCVEVSTSHENVQIANYNSPQQIVVAGHVAAVDKLCAKAEEHGARAVKLAVSAPFHSRLMAPAKLQMSPLLSDTEFFPGGEPATSVIANVTGAVVTQYTSKELIEQIDSPVRWTQTMQTAHEAGCRTYVEVGPGKVLMGLGKRILPRGEGQLVHADDLLNK